VEERLSPDDAHILALESPAIAGHTLKVLILEPASAPLDLEQLRASVDARLPKGSRGRDRVELGPGGATDARWVADEGFDVAAQVNWREGTDGVDLQGAWAAASRIMSERLDHARPLWAIDLVGPLADGREMIVVRIHHAMADGITCVRFLSEILWDEEAVEATPASHRALPESPGERSRLDELRRLPAVLGRELGHRASRTSLARHIGSGRELAFSHFPLADLKAIGKTRAEHVTVNDVFLAGVTGGLRSWLTDRSRRLPKLRAQIPVSLHHRGEAETELGNRDSYFNVDLPLREPDPVTRLELINAETERAKELADPEELYDFFHALGRFHHLDKAAERLATGPREFSLSVSNVPGPRGALSVAGRPVERLCSVAEPADRHALRISAISRGGNVGIGLCTDPDAVEGVAELAEAIDASLAELKIACGC
jgi:diacylglycerol O-acyltransferase / wax synthase